MEEKYQNENPDVRIAQYPALEEWAGPLAGEIRHNEPMSLHTTFKIGGPADLFYEPDSEERLIRMLVACKACGVPVTLIGRGSNLLVADQGIRGMVIALGGRYATLQDYTPAQLAETPWFDVLGRDGLRGDMFYSYAESGVLLSDLSARAGSNGWSGLEFACGIPGTVGGAVYMNAGAYGASMSDVVIATRYLDDSLQVRTLVGHAHQFDYRRSYFRDHQSVILGTLIMLQQGDHELIARLVDDYTRRRSETQPLDYPSAGSIFKRPAGHYTGKLITDAGLRGHRIGGAAVSDKHAGFIVNNGTATAQDVLDLIRTIQSEIFDRYGVRLETELQMIGDFPDKPM